MFEELVNKETSKLQKQQMNYKPLVTSIAVKQEDASEVIHVRVLTPEQDYHEGVKGEHAFDPGDLKDWSF